MKKWTKKSLSFSLFIHKRRRWDIEKRPDAEQVRRLIKEYTKNKRINKANVKIWNYGTYIFSREKRKVKKEERKWDNREKNKEVNEAERKTVCNSKIFNFDYDPNNWMPAKPAEIHLQEIDDVFQISTNIKNNIKSVNILVRFVSVK